MLGCKITIHLNVKLSSTFGPSNNVSSVTMERLGVSLWTAIQFKGSDGGKRVCLDLGLPFGTRKGKVILACYGPDVTIRSYSSRVLVYFN